ncbi:MAG: tRNA pseudouridine(55) synthase TruB [Candidatus Marinimicrobia bacterium]|jgi:tRNA pseudouridine55 synthase|nr:tRNA pseudouridine(55) synthase TruB [Candidatus Neomarinimicrobiota bacterium]MBT3618191.1 tRNA pseudouridine(55) synthase TruB [Candidatus Neomarinimicrobiota bacterium]MBT3828662.1 tRNA pseudouridine(55) synthase TruB [Candidatus Neomarinimicrobiota bacterium]MBT3996876.1 tRNA pseudouridine(55) synthase TruB [Candidatus Neomarinimicrobiota bacterium]MBT4280840.1 tRNA pseudouridine(55) synthase TruB [Candidatus Neomarinimicrobiota bacterium]
MILNLYKPIGWTSFDVVKKVRGITRVKKVGHGGTLDPFAEGVLLIGTGKDTKSLTEISAQSKSYTATLTLGSSTDSLDLTGNILEKNLVPQLTDNDIAEVLTEFLADQEQIPPMYSAKKIDGVRLYKLARKNISVERKPVPIHISQIQLEKFVSPNITFNVHCSKGTYIRVLGADIAEKLGTSGHLTYLQRRSVGNYLVEDSLSLKEFEKSWTSAAA